MRNCNSGLFILPFVSGIKFVEQIKFHTFCKIFFCKNEEEGVPSNLPPTLKLVRHERDPWWRGCTHFHEKVCGVCSLRLVYKYYWITFIMTIFWVLCRAKTFVRTSGVLCGGSIIGRPIWDYFSDTVHQMDQHSALSLCSASEKLLWTSSEHNNPWGLNHSS